MSAGATGRRTRPCGEDGQATVELALLLPVVCGLLLLVVQVGLVARAQILLTAAARETARVAAVDPDRGAAVEAGRTATGLDADRLRITVADAGEHLIAVRAAYEAPVGVPFLGIFRRRVELVASLTVRSEQSDPEPDVASPE